MTVDHIRYDILTQEALRGVVRTVLTDAATKGLPGEHHFFISFHTTAEGVRLSPRLQALYPTEMTIVLQHQFWDLIVTDELFEVGLSFNGIPERLVVPFEAIKGFFDPSVQFALQFATAEELDAADGEKAETESEPPSLEAANPSAPIPLANASESKPAERTSDEDKPPEPGDGAAIVSLDRFRKKK
jgi:uncharacterized protein